MAPSPDSSPSPPEESSSPPPPPSDSSSSTSPSPPSQDGGDNNGGGGSQSPPSDGGSDKSQSPPSPPQSTDQGNGDDNSNNNGDNNNGNNGDNSNSNSNSSNNNNNDKENNNDNNNNKDNNNSSNNNKDDNNNNGNNNNSNNNNSNGNDGGSNNNDNNNSGGGSNSNSKNNSPSPPTPVTGGGSSSQKHTSPTHQLAPPKSSEKGSSSSSGGHGTDVNIPLVVGVTAGVGLFFLMLLVVFLCCGRKKKRHHGHGGHMNYYTSPSHGGGHPEYYHNAPPPQWSSVHSAMPPPPGMGGTGPPSGGPWHAPPPPPPMGMGHSSEMSSSYSGPHGPPLPPPSPNIALGFNKSTFTYDELAAATNGFSQENLLGQGGFGYVHKGVLSTGKEIAVKSLKSGSGQGEREFQAEVEIISRVHHRHLVSLVGYCIAGGQRMLVYEFVPNGTLEHHLYAKGQSALDFNTRVKIALGSAKGLAYLHEDCHPKIIHRDIKTANILLDYKFEAMVADFGLAKLSQDNYTHVSTRIMGTFGYLAPEYASSGKLTEKSDVFSFGVMLLELITGRRPIDTTGTMMDDSLVDWAKPLMAQGLANGNFDDLADPRMEGNYDPTEMARLVACANASVRHSARRRPKMSQIVRALEGDSSLEDLNDGARPGQSSAFSSSPGTSGSDYDSGSYQSQMRHFQRVALASEEFPSGECATSEYHGDTAGSDNSREMRPLPNPRRPM